MTDSGERVKNPRNPHEIADQQTSSREGERIGGPDAGNYYYSRDHLGSVREVTNATGALKAQYDYDAWGNQIVVTGNMSFDFGYTGHYRHAPSNLYLAEYRAYDPTVARWISRDPVENPEIKEGPNLYWYVRNNPLNSWDPEGLEEAPAGSGTPSRSLGLTRHEGVLTFVIGCPPGKKVANVRAHYDLLTGALGPNPDPGSTMPGVSGVNCGGGRVIVEMPMRTRYTSLIFGTMQFVRFYVDFTSITYDCVSCCP